MGDIAKIPVLLEVIAFTRWIEGEFVAELPPQERLASGSPEDWAAKDLVAHVTTWRERGIPELKAARLGRLDPEAQEFDEVNRTIFDANRSLRWEEVLQRAEAADRLGGRGEHHAGVAEAERPQADQPFVGMTCEELLDPGIATHGDVVVADRDLDRDVLLAEDALDDAFTDVEREPERAGASVCGAAAAPRRRPARSHPAPSTRVCARP